MKNANSELINDFILMTVYVLHDRNRNTVSRVLGNDLFAV
jgi:hypothetical protein